MGAKDLLTGRLIGSADKLSDKQVAETLQLLVAHAVQRGASDIHIEPHERFVLVRYRIDGALRGVHKLPRAALGSLMEQLKKVADLQSAETRAPQEGEYTQTVGEQTVGVRLSTMPVFGGEKAVLHLTLDRGKPANLANLGFWGDGLECLQRTLATPHGLLIVAGPQHNGVGSTLFSLLDQLNSPMVSIATVETARHHQLPGINHTYVADGLNIHDGLRAALKQDPNIIMLGDVPDGGTAELAIHAATQGHLVLAGMHADTSLSAVLRLRASGVEPFLLVSALTAAIGQRLVRRLCPDCRERYSPTDAERQQLERSFGVTTLAARKRINDLERAMAPTVFGDVKQLSSTQQRITGLWRPSDTGCDTCDHTGYHGRAAIVEVLQNTPGVQKILLGGELPTVATLQAAAVKDDFIPMALDGLIKALRGQTTIAEVLRAVHTAA